METERLPLEGEEAYVIIQLVTILFLQPKIILNLHYLFYIHRFSANLGDSACILEIVHEGNFGGSEVRRPVGHDSTAAMSKLVALLQNYMQSCRLS